MILPEPDETVTVLTGPTTNTSDEPETVTYPTEPDQTDLTISHDTDTVAISEPLELSMAEGGSTQTTILSADDVLRILKEQNDQCLQRL